MDKLTQSLQRLNLTLNQSAKLPIDKLKLLLIKAMKKWHNIQGKLYHASPNINTLNPHYSNQKNNANQLSKQANTHTLQSLNYHKQEHALLA